MLRDADLALRAQGPYAAGNHSVPWFRILALVVAGAFVYGAVMGAYGLRGWQALFSALKVPVLLSAATLICLPSFFVANTLLGLRDDLSDAVRGVLTAQATVAIVLASLAPVTALAYVTPVEYQQAILTNGMAFAIAAAAGQATLGRHYRPLVAKNPRHKLMWRAWLVLYVFVAIQLAWVLRPFVGSPNRPTRFFREDAWSNAYVVVFDIVRGVFGG